MKKIERPQYEKDSDINRFRAMTKKSYDDIWSFDGETHPEHVCGYEYGYFLEIDNVNRSYNVITVVEGEVINQSNFLF